MNEPTLRHACPRCRAPLELRGASDAPRCGHCGLQGTRNAGIAGFLPNATVSHWQAFYDDKATGEEGGTTHGVGYNVSIQHRYIVEGFRAICGQPPAGTTILDVGCGNGLFWQALLDGRPAVGVDFSLRMCVLAQARGMEVYQADATALPFADEQFDLVYSAEIVQCIENLAGVLSELARVCRPDGRVVVSTLNRSSLLRGAIISTWLLLNRQGASRETLPIRRTAREVAALAQSMSLSLNRVCWTHFPLPWVYGTATTRYLLEPFASNVILEFVKSSR